MAAILGGRQPCRRGRKRIAGRFATNPIAIALAGVPRLLFLRIGAYRSGGTSVGRRCSPPVTGVLPHVTLKLVMIRCPDNVTPERREVRGGEFTIGRGQGNEWVIADPERHLSKRHCRLVYGAGVGDWELHDLSSNGTFLNQSPEPVGQGACQKVRNGDRIKFGPYELEVIIDEDRDSGVSDHGGARESHRLSDAMREPMAPRSERPFNDSNSSASPKFR